MAARRVNRSLDVECPTEPGSLEPVLDDPESFSQDLTKGVAASMPTQTVHVQAMAMGHNMLTLNPAWSLAAIDRFLAIR